MAMKSTGGTVYYPERLIKVTSERIDQAATRMIGDLSFYASRASVVDVVIGRIPVADAQAYYRGDEHSPVQPFQSVHTGSFVGFVSRLHTDAIALELRTSINNAEHANLALHSLEHALLNGAPAVTGLTQDEFGAHLDVEARQLLIYDNVPGGTGGCRLLADRRLTRWLAVARELAECHQVQCSDACRGCLFLPTRLCPQGNRSLDRQQVLRLIAQA